MFQKIIFFIIIFTVAVFSHVSDMARELSEAPSSTPLFKLSFCFLTACPSQFLGFIELALLEFSSYCQYNQFAADLSLGEKHLAVRCLLGSFWTVSLTEFLFT